MTYHEVFQGLIGAITASRLTDSGRQELAAMLSASVDPFGAARGRGAIASATEYMALHDRRERYRVSWQAFFREWDILLAPIVIVPAPPHSTVPPDDRTFDLDGRQVPIRGMMVYAGIPILSGLPATAFPIGMSKDGLPIAVQAIGPYLEDHTTIRFAGLVAEAFGGYQRPPGYD